MRKERPLLSMPIVIGPCWTHFCSQKLKKRILATFGFNRTALRPTQPKLHLMFCALFLKIAFISRKADVVWPPRSCDLTLLDYYLWGAVKDKCYADKPETIYALKDNIREAIGCIIIAHNRYCAWKLDRSCRLLHGQPRQPLEWNYFPLLTGRIVLSNK